MKTRRIAMKSALLGVAGLLLLLGLFAGAGLSPATTAHAASIVVDDAGDTLHSPGCADDGTTSPCTLRDAITFANSNAGADTITFNIPSGGACSAANTCTITLGSGLPEISTDVTIDGEPNNGHITVSGNNAYRVFFVTSGTTNIDALTIANGASGSISNISTLNVTNSTFTNNHHNAAPGGAIVNVGAMTVVNSTFYNNSATNGGAIDNGAGTATVINSTFSGNIATFAGGTVRGAGGSMTLKNNIFTNSTGGNCAGTLTADDYNLADDATCDNASQFSTGAIALGALADNGGPTQTMALGAGSAAINAGNNAQAVDANSNPLPYDQRGAGFPRIIGGTVDVGAFEADSCPAFPASVATEGELNTAIACYNALTSAGEYQITLTAEIDLTASTTAVDNANSGVELVVEGGGYAVDGQNTSGARAFIIEPNNTVTIQNITITRCIIPSAGVTDTGGAVLNKGTLTVKNSTLSDNQGAIGAAINNFAPGSTLTVINSTLSGNQATGLFAGLGGAIHNGGGSSGMTMVINSTLSGNEASSAGGAIYNGADSQLTVINSTISDNQAPADDGNGNPGTGGIRSSTDATLTLNNTIVANNTNGDCRNASGTINAQNSLIEDGLTCVNGTNSNNLTGDPNLGLLQNNGGPTFTHALLAGSIAIDTGANALAVDPGSSPLTTDQRGAGYPRIVNGTVDIGAVEASEATAVRLHAFGSAGADFALMELGLVAAVGLLVGTGYTVLNRRRD